MTTTTMMRYELVRLAFRARELRAQADEHEAQAKRKNAEARAIEEAELPELMEALGVTTYALKDGATLTLDSIVAGSPTKAKREEAYAWLRAHGHEDLIKHTVTVLVPRGEEREMKQMLELCKKLRLETETTPMVHPATLGKWARDRLKKGDELPLDLLGIYVGQRVKITEPANEGE